MGILRGRNAELEVQKLGFLQQISRFKDRGRCKDELNKLHVQFLCPKTR